MMKRNKKLIAVFIGVAVCASILAGCASNSKKNSSNQSNASNVEDDLDADDVVDDADNIEDVDLQETVRINKDLLFCVDSVTADENIIKDKKPAEGMQFVLINCTITNTSNEDSSYATLVSAIQVKDKQGKIFKKDNAELIDAADADTIPAGQEVSCSYLVQAPKDKNLQDLSLVVDGGNNQYYYFELADN